MWFDSVLKYNRISQVNADHGLEIHLGLVRFFKRISDFNYTQSVQIALFGPSRPQYCNVIMCTVLMMVSLIHVWRQSQIGF